MALKKSKITYNENHPTTAYAKAIVAGEFPVCKAEMLLAKKHLKDLARQGTKKFPYVFDESRADRFFYFYGICKNPDNLQYYQILPHQKFDYGMQYGWVHKDTGYRKYSTIYVQQARGNIKTTGCAIEALYALTSDKVYTPGAPEYGYIIRNAEIHLMAVDKDQVNELRDPIVLISQNSPKLITRVKALKTYINGIKYGGKVRVLSKELKNKQGGKPNFIIVDEYSSHPNDKRFEAVKKGLGKKGQSTIKVITTPADDEQTNPAKKEYEYSMKILHGKIVDESYLPIIREVEQDDDIFNDKLWSKASPVFRYLGQYEYSDILFDTVKNKEFKRAFEGKDANKQREFKIFRLGMWQEKSIYSYLSSETLAIYDSLAVSEEEFDKLTYGLQKNVGVDLSKQIDLSAIADVFKLSGDRVAVNAKGYIIEKTAHQRAKIENIPYFDWIEKGYVMAMDTPVIDTEIVSKDIVDMTKAKKQKIIELVYDPYRGYEVANNLEGNKFGMKCQCVQLEQRYPQLHKPTELLLNLILERKLVHNGNPLLRWALTNAYKYTSNHGDLMKIGKVNKDSVCRIDPAAAVIDGLARISELETVSWVDRITDGADLF